MEQPETSYNTIPVTVIPMKAKLHNLNKFPSFYTAACFLIEGVVVIRSPLVFSEDPSTQVNALMAEMGAMSERFGEGWCLKAEAVEGYSMTIWKDRNLEQEDPSP